MNKMQYSGVIFVINECTILLQKKDMESFLENPGMISFFGGASENTESPDDCLKREISEELNIDIDWKLTCYFDRFLKRDALNNSIMCDMYINYQLNDADIEKLVCSEGTPILIDRRSLEKYNLTKTCRAVLENFNDLQSGCVLKMLKTTHSTHE